MVQRSPGYNVFVNTPYHRPSPDSGVFGYRHVSKNNSIYDTQKDWTARGLFKTNDPGESLTEFSLIPSVVANKVFHNVDICVHIELTSFSCLFGSPLRKNVLLSRVQINYS